MADVSNWLSGSHIFSYPSCSGFRSHKHVPIPLLNSCMVQYIKNSRILIGYSIIDQSEYFEPAQSNFFHRIEPR